MKLECQTRFLVAVILSMIVVLVTPSFAFAATTDLRAGKTNNLSAQSIANDLGLVDGHVYVLYSAVGPEKVLDVSGGSTKDGGNALLWSLNRDKNQQWTVTFDSDGRATFKCACSGKLLDVEAARKANGSNVLQWRANGGLNQKWIISKNANGTYRIASALSSNYSLDVNGGKNADGTNVQIWANNNSAAQQWRFFDVTSMKEKLAMQAKANKDVIPAGDYFVFSSAGHNMALDITGASSSDGANVETWKYNGGSAQLFSISYDSAGYAVIKNTSSSKLLDVANANPVNCANVLQWRSNGGLNQKWIIIKNSDGTYRIQSALWENLSLDVHGGLASSGTNVEVYPSHSLSNQKWIFKTPSQAGNIPISISSVVRNSFSGISLAGAKAIGIDVSFWNGDIDWDKVAAAGIDFAIIRCGYGSDYSSQDDKKFYEYINGARSAGLDIGVYLYSYATNTSMASSEANHTLRMLRSAGLSPSDLKYGVYYDVEERAQMSTSLEPICRTYCNRIKESGYSVGVYSSLSWWNSYLTSSSFNNWNRWVAQWPYKTGNRTCDYNRRYEIWQCMSDGVVPGIVGNVDMDIAY